MSFFPHYAPFFLFSAPSKWNVLFRITEIGAHKLRLHAPFTMDIIKGRLLFDAFSDVFMSCICFADTVNICGNKHIFIVIFIVIVNCWEFPDRGSLYQQGLAMIRTVIDYYIHCFM